MRTKLAGGFGGLVRAVAVATVAATGCATGGAAPDLRRLPDAPEALVQLRRPGCASGTCPVYSVSIFADGAVVYDGAANVAVLGQQRAKISAQQLRALQLSLEETHFLDNVDECCVCPDRRGTRTVVLDYRPGMVRKTVVHDPDCAAAPPGLGTLEALIEGMTGTRRWTAAEADASAIAEPAPDSDDLLLPHVDPGDAVSTLAAP